MDWLPPLVHINETGGNVAQYYELLYRHYLNDLVYDPPEFEGTQIRTMVNPLKQEKEAGFWHILEGGNEHVLDDSLRRHERIRWVRPIIQAVGTKEVLMWKRPVREGVTKPHVVLPDFSYIVILQEGKVAVTLITAFPVDRARRRQDYRKEWERCQQGV